MRYNSVQAVDEYVRVEMVMDGQEFEVLLDLVRWGYLAMRLEGHDDAADKFRAVKHDIEGVWTDIRMKNLDGRVPKTSVFEVGKPFRGGSL